MNFGNIFMKYLKLELDEKTYQDLKNKFNDDEKAMHDFVLNSLTDNLTKTRVNENNHSLEDYLKSSKPGSRSYGTKGQGW